MKLLRTYAFAIAAAIAIAACGGHGSVPSTSQPVLTPYTGPQALAAFEWGEGLMQGADYVGPAKFGSISIDVQLRMQDQAGLREYARAVSDPKSPLYRRFLTPEEIGDRFGASSASAAAAAAYFQSYNLGVGTWPQRLSMVVTGSQADMEAALGTTFGEYSEFGQTFIAPMQQPHFSRVVPVSGMTRLVHVQLAHTFLIRATSGQIFGMGPQQLRRAFDLTGAASAGYDGTGINVGIIGTGPIWKNDVPQIGAMYGTRVANVAIAPVSAQTPSAQNHFTGSAQFDPQPTGLVTPPPVTAPCSGSGNGFYSATCNPEDGEAQLDTEQAAELAPGANVLFYIAYNNQDCGATGNPFSCATTDTGVEGIALTDDEIQQAIADNTADTLSLSFGEDENSAQHGGYFDTTGAGYGPNEGAALAAEGIAVFVSSGDEGAHACVGRGGTPSGLLCVSYPASDPSVVAAGGVNYPMDAYGNLPPDTQITAWGQNTTLGGSGAADNSGGSGGGISRYFSIPSWQSGVASVVGSMRGIPDMSADADPLTGPLLLQYGNFPGTAVQVGASGGTSASAPELAAIWGVVLQACKASPACATAGGAHPWRLGNPNPLLYQILGNSSQYAATFYDVVCGSSCQNSVVTGTGVLSNGYPAAPGYDLVTGIGVPFTGHLINAIVAGQHVP